MNNFCIVLQGRVILRELILNIPLSGRREERKKKRGLKLAGIDGIGGNGWKLLEWLEITGMA